MVGKIQEIHKVCLNGNMKRFNELIKEPNFKVNVRDNINFTPLMCAAFSGNSKMVKKLLKFKNVQINARSRNGKTALILAATRGYIDVVKILFNHGANPNLKQFQNSKKPCTQKTALNTALMCRHEKVSKFLKKKKTLKSKKYKHWKP